MHLNELSAQSERYKQELMKLYGRRSPDCEPAEETAPAAASVTLPSDDGGTEIVFNADGTYIFKFAAYNIEDAGTYTFENGTLKVINANSAEATAEGDPLKLHYVSAVSDQLTGDFTIPANTFAK